MQPFPLVQRTPGISYWIVYPEMRRHAAPVRAFRDWILGEVRRTP